MIVSLKKNLVVATLLLIALALLALSLSSAAGAVESSQQVVTKTGIMNSAAWKEDTVECPAGKSIYASGAEITWGSSVDVPHSVHLVSIVPSLKADGKTGKVLAAAAEDQDGVSADWAIKIHVVCG